MPIKKSHYLLSLFVVTGLVLLPIFNSRVMADEIVGVYGSVDTFTITTSDMTLMINDYKPSFTWWFYNQTTSDEKYNVRFTRIYEYFGTDPYLDSVIELGGINYNLLTSEWDTAVTGDSYNGVLNLTLGGLANGAELQIITHVSAFNRNINNTDYIVKPFIEAEIDVTIKNWLFTPGAQGVALKLELFESQQINDVIIKNSSSYYPAIDALDFMNYDNYPPDQASFKWVEVANYYNDTVLNSTDFVGTAFFNETYSPPSEEKLHLWISYPKVEDRLTIKHTGILGLHDDSTDIPTYVYGLPIYAIISIIALVNISHLIVKRKKHRHFF